MTITIRDAARSDAPRILKFINDLAEYEKLGDEAQATAGDIERDLFGPSPRVFCQIAEWNGTPAGFALWFYTYSTFQGRLGLWLEDLFVDPQMRGPGQARVECARLEPAVDRVLSIAGCRLHGWLALL
jgi:GNAT superfamily N-acetyltransferase